MTATKRPPRRWSASTRSTRATPRTGASSSSSRAARPAESSPAPWGELAQRRARADRPEVAQPADQSWPPLPRPAAVAWAWAVAARLRLRRGAAGSPGCRRRRGHCHGPAPMAAAEQWGAWTTSRGQGPAPSGADPLGDDTGGCVVDGLCVHAYAYVYPCVRACMCACRGRACFPHSHGG